MRLAAKRIDNAADAGPIGLSRGTAPPATLTPVTHRAIIRVTGQAIAFPSSRGYAKAVATMNTRFTHRYLSIALLAFTVAATTGVLLRFGLLYGMPRWAANYTAVRHAHSHLMYFGWVTLALMALIWHYLPTLTGRVLPRLVPIQMGASALLAFLSFPAFWLNGYGTTQIGTVELPLGSMAAGLNGLVWLSFVALYLQMTWRLPSRPLAIQLWDWALALLVLAFSGALGLVATIFVGTAHPLLQQLSLHLFLDLFGIGWFNLAVLGLLWAQVGEQIALPRWLPSQSLAMLLVPAFLLGVSPAVLPRDLFWLGAVANLGAAALLAYHLRALWQRRAALAPFTRFALLFLVLYSLTALALCWPGIWRWSAGTQLRVFFLHNLLLGWVSSALLGAIYSLRQRQWQPAASWWLWPWAAGVSTMILALLGVGMIQFLPLSAGRLLHLAAWSSIAVAVVPFGWLLLPLYTQRRWRKALLVTPT